MESSKDIKKKWIKIYPSYIDKGLKCSEGRKVSASIAVDNPNIKEIFVVCAEILKLDAKGEIVYIFYIIKASSS